MKRLKIYLVDDHVLFRQGLKFLLSNASFVEEIYEAGNGESFVNSLSELHPDIALVDIEMPGMSGIEATQKALQIQSNLKIIALSMYTDESYYSSMIEAGAKGFLLKNSNFSEVEKAILEVADGRNYFSQEILQSILQKLNKSKKSQENSELTIREIEVLQQICKGLSNPEIGELLCISKRTVDKHRENLLQKTLSKNTANLVIYAIKNGYFQI